MTTEEILAQRQQPKGARLRQAGGQDLAETIEDIQRKLTEIGSAREVDSKALKRETRRLLVLMLASAQGGHEQRETIKMLSEIEGYRKATLVKPETDDESDDEIAALAKAARED